MGLLPTCVALDQRRNGVLIAALNRPEKRNALDAGYAEAMVAGIVNTHGAARVRLDAFAKGSGPKIRGERRLWRDEACGKRGPA